MQYGRRVVRGPVFSLVDEVSAIVFPILFVPHFMGTLHQVGAGEVVRCFLSVKAKYKVGERVCNLARHDGDFYNSF